MGPKPNARYPQKERDVRHEETAHEEGRLQRCNQKQGEPGGSAPGALSESIVGGFCPPSLGTRLTQSVALPRPVPIYLTPAEPICLLSPGYGCSGWQLGKAGGCATPSSALHSQTGHSASTRGQVRLDIGSQGPASGAQGHFSGPGPEVNSCNWRLG